MTKLDNQRLFTRLSIPLEAKLLLDGHIITGMVRDLSMNGCLMTSALTPAIDAEGALNLFYPDQRQDMQIEASVCVARCDDDHVALQFTGVALESYHHLRYLLMSNADDNGAVEKELVSRSGIKMRK